MTDTTIAPVAGPEAPPDTAPHPQPPEAKAPRAVAEVGHTPGGWPVLPLAVAGTNTTASLLGAAALVGGPAALAVAATGAVVLGAAAATRNRRGRKGLAKTGNGTRVPAQRRAGGLGTSGGASRTSGAAGGKTSGLRKAARPSASTAPGRTGSLHRKTAPASAGSGTAAGKARDRVGQVRALRKPARQTPPSRAERRAETTGARRSVADARRDAKASGRSTSLARKGPIGRAVSKAAGRVGKARGAVIERNRAARDRKAAGQVAGQRDAVRKAPARKRARKALWRSAARFQGRRLLAALLALPVGLLGLITTPIGRKFDIPWLMNPGRRLYWRLVRTATEQRAQRDEEIRAAQKQAEAAVDADADGEDKTVAGRVERSDGPTPTTGGGNMSGFNFGEFASEMESAAQQYEPEGPMEVLAMIEGLPDVFTSIANTMQILAERSDSEFAVEKEVAAGFNEIFTALQTAVSAAEELGPIFRDVHAADIARHEDPRNGHEAEKGWNV